MTRPMLPMRSLLLLFTLLALGLPAQARSGDEPAPLLARHFSRDQIQEAATAAQESYLNSKEQEVFTYLNLARMYPQEFASFYVSYLRQEEPQGIKAIRRKDHYYYSLYRELKTAKSQEALTPSQELYESARKWAQESGRRGVIGHKRSFSKNRGSAECCAYSYQDSALNFVMDLLIDTDIPDLGHRRILLGDYTEIGVAMGPHKKYGHCVVIDLW